MVDGEALDVSVRAVVIEFGQMSDYPYAIVLQPLGHLCGYVAVPPGHPGMARTGWTRCWPTFAYTVA